MPGKKHSVGDRIQALALIEEGIPIGQVVEVSNMLKASIYQLKKTARSRGYDPTVSPHIKEKYVADAPRTGRSKVTSTEDETRIVEHVQKSRQGRKSTCVELGHKFEVSAMIIHRILRANGLRKRKPSWKPGLTDAMKAARYEFAQRHENWLIEDWKNVIWSDETSVVLGHRRGGIRV